MPDDDFDEFISLALPGEKVDRRPLSPTEARALLEDLKLYDEVRQRGEFESRLTYVGPGA